MQKSYIWPLPTRIFHWLLVLYIAVAFLSSDIEWLLPLHSAVGYGVGVLILFRIVWGFIGPIYSRFSDWSLSIQEAIEFTTSLLHPKKHYPGHNPAASFVILGIIIIALLSVITGVLTYGIQEGRGVLAFLHSPYFKEMEVFEEVHEFFTTLLLILVAIHIAGVVVDTILHKEIKTLRSMIDGYKNIKAQDVKLNTLQKVVATLFLTAALLVPIIALTLDTPLQKSIHEPIEYEEELSLFSQECGACHTLYPPFLLPSSSWKKIMANLENHFGDDASLEEDEKKAIESFLMRYSAEHSTKEAAVYILKSIKPDTIAITKTPFWQKKHATIDKEIFNSKKVPSKANCKACHSDIEKGLIEDRNIRLPKV